MMLLLSQVFNIGIENIPPVTLALVAGQTAIFLDFLPQHFPSAAGVCMSSFLVWHRNDWRRLIVSQFFHADDFHLYYNMASLLMKGRSLERRFGSTYFAYMVRKLLFSTCLMLYLVLLYCDLSWLMLGFSMFITGYCFNKIYSIL